MRHSSGEAASVIKRCGKVPAMDNRVIRAMVNRKQSTLTKRNPPEDGEKGKNHVIF